MGDYQSMKRFRQTSTFQPLARAVMVISAIAVLATGVTFAALQSQQASLIGNTMRTASADLRIGTSASTFGATRTGFDFNGFVPGGSPVPAEGNVFYLKNAGTALLALKMSVGSTPTNVSAVDLSKVNIIITRVDSTQSQTFPLTTLVESHASGGVALTDAMSGNTIGQYKVQVSMAADAFTGTSAEIGGIDLVFVGSSVAQ